MCFMFTFVVFINTEADNNSFKAFNIIQELIIKMHSIKIKGKKKLCECHNRMKKKMV